MNPFVCASLAFLLTVSQAVAVTAKAKSGSKSKGKKSIPLIVGVVVAAVVGQSIPYHIRVLFFLKDFRLLVLIVVALIVLIKMRSRKLKRMSVPVKPQDVSYINGGPTTDPGKAGYLPHTPTLVRTLLPRSPS